jgi:hypothetical protein
MGPWPGPPWLVTLARGGYGVALLTAPRTLIRLTGVTPGRRACAVARVLGVRHLVQAGLTVAAERSDPGRPVVLGGGAAVDLLHAASMLALGAMDNGIRRTVLTDGAVETALAAAGAWAATSSARWAPHPAGLHHRRPGTSPATRQGLRATARWAE